MRRSQVIELPIITLEEGSHVGKIKEALIDNVKERVLGFVVSEKNLFKTSNKFLLIEDIKTIGDYACTISGEKTLKHGEEIGFTQHVDNYYTIGKKMIHNEGSFQGIVTDFSFDVASGHLQSFFITNQEFGFSDYNLPIDSIITLGKDVIISSTNILQGISPQKIQEDTKQLPGQKAVLNKTLEEKAIDFSLGKQVFKSVRDGQGGVIINKGEKIKPEVIDLAREKNRLPQLLFTAGVNEIIEGLDHTRVKIDEGSRRLLQNWKELKKEIIKEGTEYNKMEEKIYRYWQDRLLYTFSNLEFDYQMSINFKNQLQNKITLYRVRDENGEILKEKDSVITEEDLQNINKPENLVRLLASVTAMDLANYIQTLENQLVKQIKQNKKKIT